MALLLYVVRMFAVTGFYHRYFAHRTFRTSGLGGLFCGDGRCIGARDRCGGPRCASIITNVPMTMRMCIPPGMRRFWWAHIRWMTSTRNFPSDYEQVKDLARYPELVFLNRFDLIVPSCLALATLGFGWLVGRIWPGRCGDRERRCWCRIFHQPGGAAARQPASIRCFYTIGGVAMIRAMRAGIACWR